jgi:hypothetical protein
MVTFLRVTRMNVNVFYIILIYGLKSDVCVSKIRETNAGAALKTWRGVSPAPQLSPNSINLGSKKSAWLL